MPFQKVGAVTDFPDGEVGVVFIGDKEIAIARGDDGILYAFDNICTHEEASLQMGFLEKCEVECPLHGARFDIRTGKVIQGPAYAPVSTYPVKIEGQEIWVEA